MVEIGTKGFMEIVWVAWYCRGHVLRAVRPLTKHAARCIILDDKELARRVSSLSHSKGFKKGGFSGDTLMHFAGAYLQMPTLQETAWT